MLFLTIWWKILLHESIFVGNICWRSIFLKLLYFPLCDRRVIIDGWCEGLEDGNRFVADWWRVMKSDALVDFQPKIHFISRSIIHLPRRHIMPQMKTWNYKMFHFLLDGLWNDEQNLDKKWNKTKLALKLIKNWSKNSYTRNDSLRNVSRQHRELLFLIFPYGESPNQIRRQ